LYAVVKLKFIEEVKIISGTDGSFAHGGVERGMAVGVAVLVAVAVVSRVGVGVAVSGAPGQNSNEQLAVHLRLLHPRQHGRRITV
jgi:hypothetical protein